MKAHFIESDHSLSEGGTYLSVCGEVLDRTQFLEVPEGFLLPGANLKEQLKGVCGKCQKQSWTKTRRYVAREAINED